MKKTTKLLTLLLAVLMLVSVLPLNAFAASYAVYLHCGPEGWGSTAWPLTKTSGTPLALYHTKETIQPNYGMLPGKQVLDDQRTFIEWNTAYNATTGRGTGTAYYDYYTADEATTLYAIWGYNIQYNADGGTYPNPTSGKDIYLTYVASYNLQDQTDPKTDYSYCLPDLFGNTPTKTGCRRVDSSGRPAYALLNADLSFFCWETADQNLTIPPTGGYMEWSVFHCANSAKGTAPEFYAIWEPSVTYNANGGSGSMSTDYLTWTYDALWDYESYTAKSNKFTKSGATFTGWNTKADGSGVSVPVGTQLGGQRTNSDPITLYAQWSDGSSVDPTPTSYTITLDANGGTLSGTSTYSITTGATYMSVMGSSMPTPTRSGYTFNGWYNEKYGYTLNLSDTFNVSENVTFKAQWTQNTTETKDWTITFDPNGGTMDGPTTYGINTGEVYADVIGDMPTATRSGYTLTGWYNEKYSYTLNMSDYFAVSEDATFVAQWQQNTSSDTYATGVYKTTASSLNMRSGPGTSYSIVTVLPEETQVTVTQTSGKWGYCQYGAYTGWISLAYATYIGPAEETKYVLTFNTNGGTMPSGYSTTYKFSADEKFVDVIGGYPVPTRSGYAFEGWQRDDYTSDFWVDSWGTQPYTFGHDITVNAVWTEVAHTHSYTSSVTKAATCTTAGVRTYTCSCGDSYTEAIAAIGHSYSSTTTAPTCTSAGKTVYTCGNCGDSYTETTAALGHTYNNGTVTTAPTCEDAGIKTYTCISCGDSYTEAIAANGHSFGDYTSNDDATCSKDGTKTRTCSACGAEETVTDTGSATGKHLFYDYISNDDATCTEDGTMTAYCEYGCGTTDTIKDVGSVKGHNYGDYVYNGDATCTEDGTKTRYCSACGAIETVTDIGSAIGHSYNGVETTVPTCGADGIMTYTCVNCGDSYTEVISATGNHAWGEWIETKAPTYTETGVETRTCGTCGATETQDVPMLEAPAEGQPAVLDTTNYTVTLSGITDIKEIRFAPGHWTTGTEVRNAEGTLTLSASLVAANTNENGVFSYDVSWATEYTFWIRKNDGTGYFVYADTSDINTYLTSDGLRLTVTDMKAASLIKDMWIAEGTWTTYAEIKNNVDAALKYQATNVKLANYFATNDFTYTTVNPGEHTVLIRYNDGTTEVHHITLTVDVPVFDVNGLQVTVSNIPGIKIIRTAYGEYNSVAEIKVAAGVRNFNNKTAIKDAETYKIQYRDNGMVTMIVEYTTGYKHVEHINIQQKTPTFEQDGNTVTFGNLDGLVIVRYAPGKYTTSNGIKNAEGSKYVKPESIVDGKIVIEDLAAGTYTFCVQYDDESYNFYVLDIE